MQNSNQFRPAKLDQIIGNESIISNLKINVEVSNLKREALPHLLLGGCSGCGKSTIALAIANEIGTNCYCVNGANIKSPQYILPILLKLKERDVLFIDEVHRMNIKVEEFMYLPMEDFVAYISSKESSTSLKLPQFTCIGATTTIGSISKPLRDRFVLHETLELYKEADLVRIIQTNAIKLNLNIKDDAAHLIAKCSRGTPRLALSLLTWASNVCTVKKMSVCDLELAKYCMSRKGIDTRGLNRTDRRYLDYLSNSKEAVGVETMAAYLQVDRRTIEETIEPFLLQQGMIKKTKKGRQIML